jgi:hypothetical protein
MKAEMERRMSEGAVIDITIIIRNENKMNKKKMKRKGIREGVQSSYTAKNTLCYARSVCRHVDKSLYAVLKAQ